MPHKYLNASHQQGSMLVVTLFVIIVLSLLGLTMSRMIQSSTQSVIVELSGLRAFTAAQTGLQALLEESFPLNAANRVCDTTINSTASFSNVPGLIGCDYTATCTTQDVPKKGELYDHYRFSSVGQCNVGNLIVSRQVSLDAMQVKQ